MKRLARGPGLGLSLIVTTLLALTACSSGSNGSNGSNGSSSSSGSAGPSFGPGGSCNAGSDSCGQGAARCCADYPRISLADLKSACAAGAGVYSAAPCSTADREASCTLSAGTAAEKVIRYYTGYELGANTDPITNCSAISGVYSSN
jgi:hypothetical protein